MDRGTAVTVAALAVCLALALGGQAAADALLPGSGGDDTGQAVGRAASSYLTGIKTYVAAALWNRIDPLFHNYYQDVPFDQQRYMLTTIATVQLLDPHAVRSYVDGAFLLARNGRVDEGLAMAERGVEQNPDSGLCLANLAQMQWLYGDKDRAAEVAKRALDQGVVWLEPAESYTWHALLRDILRAQGEEELAALAEERMREFDELVGDDPMAHDHDGDGHPDH